MHIILAFFIALYPHLKIEAYTDSTGPYFVVHAPHISTDFTLYVTDLSYSKDSVLNVSYPDFDLWDRKKTEDSVFVFRPTKRRTFRKNTLYAIRPSAFDLKDKNTLLGTYYFFRLNKKGKIGIAPYIFPVMQLLSKDTLGIFFEGNKKSYASITLFYKKESPKTITHNKKSKRHEFKIPYQKDLLYYRFSLYTKYDTFTSHLVPIKYRGKIETFAIFGDTRANWAMPSERGRTDGVNEEVINNILRAIYKDEPDFVEINGDLISGYTNSKEDALMQYYAFLKSLYPYASSIPFLFTPGNHDMTAPMDGDRRSHKDPTPPQSAEDLWKNLFMQPENGPIEQKGMPPYKENVYFLDAGNWGIFFLNSDYNYAKENRKRISGNITNKEMTWFLQKSRYFKHSIVIFHEPLYSNTPIKGHALDYDIVKRDSLLNAFLRSGASLILTSHEHLYARRKIADGKAHKWIYQVTLGTGGAPIYNVPKEKRTGIDAFSKETTYGLIHLKKNKVIGLVKNINGFVVDSFKIN